MKTFVAIRLQALAVLSQGIVNQLMVYYFNWRSASKLLERDYF